MKTKDQAPSLLQTARKLSPLLRPRRLMLFFAAVLLLLSLGLDLIAPLLLKQLIDTTLGKRDLHLLNAIIAAFVGLYFVRFGADLLSGRLRNRFNEGLLLDLRRLLFRHVQTLSSPFFAGQRSAYLASRILNDAALLSAQMMAIFLGALSSSLLLCGSVAIVFWLNWQLAVVLCLVGPVLVFLTRRFGQRTRHATEEAQERGATLNAGVQESLAGIGLIQSYTLEEYAEKRVGAEMEGLRAIGVRWSSPMK